MPFQATTTHIEQEQLDKLRELKKRTGTPIAWYIRQGIDAILKKEEDKRGFEEYSPSMHVDRTVLSPSQEVKPECGLPTPYPLLSSIRRKR